MQLFSRIMFFQFSLLCPIPVFFYFLYIFKRPIFSRLIFFQFFLPCLLPICFTFSLHLPLSGIFISSTLHPHVASSTILKKLPLPFYILASLIYIFDVNLLHQQPQSSLPHKQYTPVFELTCKACMLTLVALKRKLNFPAPVSTLYKTFLLVI
jgi:hypothetical protein